MLTDQQLNEIALRIVQRALNDLDTLHRDDVGEALCRDHCTEPDCGHNSSESAAEIRTVQDKTRELTNVLRQRLAEAASFRGVQMPVVVE